MKAEEAAFRKLCKQAADNRWCTKRFCTTCRGQDFRAGLKAAGLEIPGKLASAMMDVDLSELSSVHGWDGCLEFCVSLLEPAARDALLKHWSGDLDKHVRLADLILFRFLRCSFTPGDLADRWSESCVALAIRTADHSLVETLLIVRPEKVKANSAFLGVATMVAGYSTKVSKLLKKLGIKVE